MNTGEKHELFIQIKLTQLRDCGELGIKSVGFAGREYGSLSSEDAKSLSLSLSDSQLDKMAKSIGINKAPSGAKSDVYINHKGISLKSLHAAPPALVNHTTRPGFHRVCNEVGRDIAILDEIIDEYWALREAGKIAEDTKTSDLSCPFNDHSRKEYMRPILEYFLFKGTGSSDSKYPADKLIEFLNPLSPTTWRAIPPDKAVDDVWNKLIFSVRAKKGMPRDYDPNTYRKLNAESIARWVKHHSGEYRGALHIRVKK